MWGRHSKMRKEDSLSCLISRGKLLVLVSGRSGCNCEAGVVSLFPLEDLRHWLLGKMNLGLGPGVESCHKSKLGPAGGSM